MLHKQALFMSNKILFEGAHNEGFVPSLCHDLRDTLLRFLAENNVPTTNDNGCFNSFKDVFPELTSAERTDNVEAAAVSLYNHLASRR